MKLLGEKKLHHTNRYLQIVLATVLLGGGVNPIFAASAPATTLHDAAAQLTKDLNNDPDVQKIIGERIVIAPFENINGRGDAVPRILQEMFTTDFIKAKHFKVLERDQLQSALTELHFQLSDLSDPAKAKKIGKLVGAAYVLLGSISDTGTSTSINARIVSIESGESVAAEDEDIKTSDAPLAASGLNPALIISTPAATASTDNTPVIDLNANATPTTAGQFTGKKDNFGLLGGTGFKIAWREDLGKDPVYAFSAGDVLGDGTTRFVEYMMRQVDVPGNDSSLAGAIVDHIAPQHREKYMVNISKWNDRKFEVKWESEELRDLRSMMDGIPRIEQVHLYVSPATHTPALITLSNSVVCSLMWRWDGTTYPSVPLSFLPYDLHSGSLYSELPPGSVLQWLSSKQILRYDFCPPPTLQLVDVRNNDEVATSAKPLSIQSFSSDGYTHNDGAAAGDFDGDGNIEIATAVSSDIKSSGNPIEVWGKKGRKAVTATRYGSRLTTWNPSGAKCPFIVARKNTANEQGEPNGGFVYFIQWRGENYDEVWHSNKIGDEVIDMQVCDPKSEGKAGLVILSRQDKNYFLTKIVLAK